MKHQLSRLRTAFVMEQALGHVTHYRNLREFADRQTDIEPVWLPIPFDVRGAARLVPLVRSNWSVRASLRARRALDRALAEHRLDALVFHTQVTSLFSTDLMRRVPSLISLDATPINYDSVGTHYGHRPPSGGFLDRQKYQLNRRAFHAAAGLVTWSEWARRSLVDDYGVPAEQIRVLAPGAGQAYFDIGRARTEADPSPEVRRTRLLFVGGDFRRKGGQLLLDSMAGALGSRCELHIVTTSDVPASSNVIVHRGLQPNSPALQALFASADLFVLPTQADCMALVIMEAAAAGLPVITTDVGAMSEGVLANESGLIIPAGDARALDAALAALINDPERLQRMGRASYALGRQKFAARRNNRLLLDFVGELAATARADSRRVA